MKNNCQGLRSLLGKEDIHRFRVYLLLLAIIIILSVICVRQHAHINRLTEKYTTPAISDDEKEPLFNDALSQADPQSQTMELFFFDDADKAVRITNENRSPEDAEAIRDFISKMKYDREASSGLVPEDYEGIMGGVSGCLNIAVSPSGSVHINIHSRESASVFYRHGQYKYAAEYILDPNSCDSLRALCGLPPIPDIEDLIEEARKKQEQEQNAQPKVIAPTWQNKQ